MSHGEGDRQTETDKKTDRRRICEEQKKDKMARKPRQERLRWEAGGVGVGWGGVL